MESILASPRERRRRRPITHELSQHTEVQHNEAPSIPGRLVGTVPTSPLLLLRPTASVVVVIVVVISRLFVIPPVGSEAGIIGTALDGGGRDDDVAGPVARTVNDCRSTTAVVDAGTTGTIDDVVVYFKVAPWEGGRDSSDNSDNNAAVGDLGPPGG